MQAPPTGSGSGGGGGAGAGGGSSSSSSSFAAISSASGFPSVGSASGQRAPFSGISVSFALPAGRGAWDADQPNCSLCRAEFKLTRRRHHCRTCGRCVCNLCSPHLVRLAGPGARRQRVCAVCVSPAAQSSGQPSSSMFPVPEADGLSFDGLNIASVQAAEELRIKLAEAEGCMRQAEEGRRQAEADMRSAEERVQTMEQDMDKVKRITFSLAEKLQALATGTAAGTSQVPIGRRNSRGGALEQQGGRRDSNGSAFGQDGLLRPGQYTPRSVTPRSLTPRASLTPRRSRIDQSAEGTPENQRGARRLSGQDSEGSPERQREAPRLSGQARDAAEKQDEDDVVEPVTLEEAAALCEAAILPISESLYLLRQARQTAESKAEQARHASERMMHAVFEAHSAKEVLLRHREKLRELSAGSQAEADAAHFGAQDQPEPRTLDEIARECEIAMEAFESRHRERLTSQATSSPLASFTGGHGQSFMVGAAEASPPSLEDDAGAVMGSTLSEGGDVARQGGAAEDARAMCSVCHKKLGKRYFTPKKVCGICDRPVCAACSPSQVHLEGQLRRACTGCTSAAFGKRESDGVLHPSSPSMTEVERQAETTKNY